MIRGDTVAVQGRRCAARLSAAALSLFVLTATPEPTRAADGPASVPPPSAGYQLNDRSLGLGYDVYLGGIYAFHFEAVVRLNGASYDVVVAGGTTGFIGRMFSWQANLRSAGALASATSTPAGVTPATFESATTWQGKPRTTLLRFDGDGRYEVSLEPADDADSARADSSPPAVLPIGTMDPVAASMAALATSARDGTCAQRQTVFDGKRYYELIIRDGDGDNVAPRNHLSAYSGPALKCRVAMRRLAGFNKRRYAQYWDDESGTLPTIWSASLAPGMPLVPVRFLAPFNVGANIGSMMIHLVHAEIREDGTTRTLVDLAKSR